LIGSELKESTLLQHYIQPIYILFVIMADADDFSRDNLSVNMDSRKYNKTPTSAAQAVVSDFHKKVINYDAKNFPANNQNTFCW